MPRQRRLIASVATIVVAFLFLVQCCFIRSGLSPGVVQAASSGLRVDTWQTQVTSLETEYCLQQNVTKVVQLGTSSNTNLTTVLLKPVTSGSCNSLPAWRGGVVAESYVTGTLKSVLFGAVNNTTTSTEWSHQETSATSVMVGVAGQTAGTTVSTTVTFTHSEIGGNSTNYTMMFLIDPGGTTGQTSGNSLVTLSNPGSGCGSDVWDGMYFADLGVTYPHDSNSCYNHASTLTWWTDGSAMTHFTWGSVDVNAMSTFGPAELAAAIGSVVGSQGGWQGAAAGAILGVAIGGILVYIAGNVWIDENNNVVWWSNQAFFHYLHGVPWYYWLSVGASESEAALAWSKLTYLRVGNSDYANSNSVTDPS
jgi:hypothetical protein